MTGTVKWTKEQIDSYYQGVKYSDYPRVFWEKIEALAAGCRTLLDVGCGPGAFALVAAQQGMQVQGVDVNRDSLVALNAMSKSMGLSGLTTVWGRWPQVDVAQAEVCVSAYCFGNGIGTKPGIQKIVQVTGKVAFLISPADRIKTDFQSDWLYQELKQAPLVLSGDYQDLLQILHELGQQAEYEAVLYDFGMPLPDIQESTMQKCTEFLCNKFGFARNAKALKLVRTHLEQILTSRNGMYWIPNPKKSVMITLHK